MKRVRVLVIANFGGVDSGMKVVASGAAMGSGRGPPDSIRDGPEFV